MFPRIVLAGLMTALLPQMCTPSENAIGLALQGPGFEAAADGINPKFGQVLLAEDPTPPDDEPVDVPGDWSGST